ncbi:MAG: aminomethyl-transferring glycine dehydrogenase [Flavobacteriales bacterium AspAUS03]
MENQKFHHRHIGPTPDESHQMLQMLGYESVDALIDEIIPPAIRMKKDLDLPRSISEYEWLVQLQKIGAKNQQFRSYIGLGYHNTILPPVIQRNILENPGWYTAYTPYQAEISQGRLEALINFQTMVVDLTGMSLANASLLDEGTAAAEAMQMLYQARSKEKKKKNAIRFFVLEEVFPQTLAVLKTRAHGLGIMLVVGTHKYFSYEDDFFGMLLQYPDASGEVFDHQSLVRQATERDIAVVVAADLLALTLLKSPGEWGVDVVVGTTQRLGIPMGYGGPHAAYFATREKHKRFIPGRVIGQSVDKSGKKAFRMALQTREQHIKRERATSNICTAQVLLAVMAGMYAVYHGPNGLQHIAQRIHKAARKLEKALNQIGLRQLNAYYFDALRIDLRGWSVETLKTKAESHGINFRYIDPKTVGISLDETTSEQDLKDIVTVFTQVLGMEENTISLSNDMMGDRIPDLLKRTAPFLTHEVFQKYHTETELMRYIKRLERKDLALNHSMIPLGSCTMKLNAAATLFCLSRPEWSNIHPFVPDNQVEGFLKIIQELENDLNKITGFAATSLQPNSGAQGEYAGLMVIRAYHKACTETQRNIVLIPASAHGTNPASAVMAGMKVVVIKTTKKGDIDIEDLKTQAEKHQQRLAALMVTYPSTHGVYETDIREIIHIIHEHGGQVYMDGANMNAQIGFTHPALIGADVCHLNLHKTFAIPHGGGGPGVGPICVAAHLKPFLPSHPFAKSDSDPCMNTIAVAPYGSALILIISYAYIRMLGGEGLKRCTEAAILNANYLKARLEMHFDILYTGKNNTIAHEMIVDCRVFKSLGVEVIDIAKRLMDYGYHAPTVSFPVPGTLMIEPTESENKEELDRFAEALIHIKKEIDEIAKERLVQDNNLLKNAPHTLESLTSDHWTYPYTRKQAAYPLSWVQERKFWPAVARIEEAYGDRNLICTCSTMVDSID